MIPFGFLDYINAQRKMINYENLQCYIFFWTLYKPMRTGGIIAWMYGRNCTSFGMIM